MPEDKNTAGNEDKVDVNKRHEVEALHQQWKQFSHAHIVDAIKQYGPYKKDIETYLSKQAEVL